MRGVRRPYRRRMYPRKNLSSQNKIYSFKRSVMLAPCQWISGSGENVQASNQVTNSSGAGYFQIGHFKFALTDLPNYSDFINLYERFKITGVKLKFIPIHGDGVDVQGGGAVTANLSPLAIAISREAVLQSSDERTFDQLLEQQDCKVYTSQRPFSLYIPYPKFYAPADGLTTVQEKGGWIRSATGSSVHHWGLRYAFPEQNSYATSFRVICTYFVKCANPQ